MRQMIRETLKRQYRKRGLLYFLYRSCWDPIYPLLCLHAAYWQARSAITGEKLVHFIGDSHTTPYNFGRKFVVHHIGQATAHNLCREESSSDSGKILARVLSGISPRRDVVGLVFGEIDCRIHFHYQHKKTGRGMERLMGDTIANYAKVMEGLRKRGYSFFVVGVPPAGRQENVYKYPFYGSAGERSRIYRQFNARLGAHCRKGGIPYLDLYPLAADSEGFVKKEFCRDEIHLNGRAVPYAQRFLGEKFGIGF